MISMDDSSQTSILQRWRREQEEQRQYQILRRRRYLQTERQHQRHRLVMAAMEQHERRRKRYQRALEQRRGEQTEDAPSIDRVDPTRISKLDTLATIKYQLENCIQNCMDFLDGMYWNHSMTRWTLFKRWLVLLVYEDMLMRLLLRLDGVSSDGDDTIREQRKALVKRTNRILEHLDQYKQRYQVGGMRLRWNGNIK